MIFKPCGACNSPGYRRVPPRRTVAQSFTLRRRAKHPRERRQPVCEEVTIGSVQGFPDLLSQLGRGADVLGLPVSQGRDPIRQREGHRQRPDPRDHGQTGRQVGHNPAPVPGLVGGPLIDAERRADDPVNLEPVIGGADPEGCRTPTHRCQRLVCPARSAGSASCQDALYDPLTLDFVGPFRNVQHAPVRSG